MRNSSYPLSKWRWAFLGATAALVLVGCGGGGGGGSSNSTPPQNLSRSVSGGGVKGPLANAAFALYKVDTDYTNFQAATAAASGQTTPQAKFSIDILTADLDPPYILVFTADSDTTDLMTGGAPLLTSMKTVVTQEMLDSGANIYATPLTTMAVDVAIRNSNSDRPPYTSSTAYTSATVVKDKFLAALPIAAQEVKSTLGFGLGEDIDIYTTSPIVDSSSTSDANLNNTAQYRGAVEALGAVVAQLRTQVSESIGQVDNDTMIEALVDDLADGAIDGQDAYGNNINVLPTDVRDTLENTDPQQLIVPGTTQTVAQMTQRLADETSQTGNTSTSTTSLTDSTITITTQPAQTNPDRDGDGVPNSDDAFPDNASESKDTDKDGIGNNADTDDDNDGWLDADDDYPTDATQYLDPALDRDGDTQLNGADPCPLDATNACVGITDTDGDGVEDTSDNCPTMSNPAQTNTDGDTYDVNDPATGGNVCDNDDDGDSVADANDAFPLDATESVDTDKDGIGNNTDTDDDNDGVLDVNEATGCSLLRDCDGDGRMDKNDAFPLNPAEWLDTDGDCGVISVQSQTSGDGCGNNSDPDIDGDGEPNATDAFPLDPTRSANITDADADGIDDASDNCVGLYNPLQKNRDGDSMGDLCDDDDDGDGVLDANDAFPLDPNESVDTDHDGIGNNADTDDDNDGVADGVDAFPLDATESVDTDSDGTGNNADTDDDNDGVLDVNEASASCRLLADCDGDGVGDATDAFPTNAAESADTDSDGIGNNGDNCPSVTNADQLNTDGANDGGNACDTDDDNDGTLDVSDAFPQDASESVDTDGDGIGNNADTDDDNDGLSDNAEATKGTNPLVADTDGDGVGDAGDNCPITANATQTDTDGDGIGDVCDMGGTSGAYSLTHTTTAHVETTEPEVGWCWGTQDQAELNVAQSTYLSVNVSGSAITIGGTISGTVNPDGSFTATETTSHPDSYWNGSSVVNISVAESLTLTGTVTGTTVSGTYTETQTSGSVLDCSRSGTLSAFWVHTPAGENYDGVYALELDMNRYDEASQTDIQVRGAYAIELDFNAAGGTVTLFDGGSKTESSSYDPISGGFILKTVEEDVYDENGDGNLDLIRNVTDVSGVLIAAPGGSTPELWLDNVESADYIYLGTSTTVPPTYTAGMTEDWSKWDMWARGYGKMKTATPFNRAFTNPVSGSDNIVNEDFLGLEHPPMKPATPNGSLYFAAYAGATATGTALCSVSYADRMQWREQLPRPDFTIMALQTAPYSVINCPLTENTVTALSDYTLVVRDDNGTPGFDATATADDTTVFSVVHPAEAVATYPGVKQNRRTLSLNGATSSQTEAGDFIPVSGFFNPSADTTLSWPTVSGANQYSVRLWEFDPMMGKEDTELRLTTTGTSTTLPANSMRGMMAARLMARYSSAGNHAFSQSKHVVFMPGVNGLTNVELAHSSGGFSIFQLDLNTGKDSSGNMTVYCGETTEQGVNCSSTGNSIDWTVDTGKIGAVSLAMVDNTGDITGVIGTPTPFTLTLTFTDAVNATATTSVAGWSGVARVVMPELVAMNRARPGATNNKSTQLVLQNAPPFYGMGVLTTASGTTVLDGVSATSKTFWDSVTTFYTDTNPVVGNSFKVFPVGDGEAQFNGGYVSYDSYGAAVADTELVLADDQYRFTVSGHPFGLPDRTFKVDYTYVNPTGTVGGPLRTAITYNSTAASTGNTVANAIDVTTSGPTQFTLTWTDLLPATTQWRVMVQVVDGSGNPVPHADIRTKQLDAAASGSELSYSAGTWTWSNSDSLLDLGLLQSGETARIILDSRTPDGTMRGTSQPFFVKMP